MRCFTLFVRIHGYDTCSLVFGSLGWQLTVDVELEQMCVYVHMCVCVCVCVRMRACVCYVHVLCVPHRDDVLLDFNFMFLFHTIDPISVFDEEGKREIMKLILEQ